MNSLGFTQANESVGDSAKSLIDWSSPDIVKDSFYTQDWLNNPFDIMEFKAANMDPFDLVLNQTPLRKDPPCSNFLSPKREPKVIKMRKSVSLPNFDKANDVFVEHFQELVKDKDSLIKYQSNLEDISTIVKTFQSNKNNSMNIIEKKTTNNQEHKTEVVLEQDLKELNMEQISLCNEEEIKQIREQTRQRIKMLIKQEKQVYEEKCSRRSLSICTPQRKSNASLDSCKSLFNKGLMESDLNYNNSDSSKHLISDNLVDSKEFPNASLAFPAFFDINLLKPEWVEDNFYDNDASLDVQHEDNSVAVDNNQINVKLKALNRIGTIESKTNRSKTSMLTRRIPNKGPFLANVPLQHMMQNYNKINFKPINPQSINKPVVTSATTLDTNNGHKKLDTGNKTPSVNSRLQSLSKKSLSNSTRSPKIPVSPRINPIKFAGKYSTNVLNDLQENTSQKPYVLHSSSSTKSETKIGKVPLPVATNTRKVTGLPVSKRFTKFKGKENVIP